MLVFGMPRRECRTAVCGAVIGILFEEIRLGSAIAKPWRRHTGRSAQELPARRRGEGRGARIAGE